MRSRITALVVIVFLLLISAVTFGQQKRWLMYGTVTWSTGTPAASTKLSLLRGGKETTATYTNQQGRYGFFGTPGQPSDYTLQVWFGSKLVRTFSSHDLQQIQRGGRFDIHLQRQQ